MPSRNRRKIITGAIICFGVITLGVHIYHFFKDGEVLQLLTGVVPPMIVSVGLLFVAAAIYRSSLQDRYLPRFSLWVLGGTVALVVLGFAIMLYQLSHGAKIYDFEFMIVNWAATGALGGSFIGYYDAKLQQTHSELERERDLLSEQQTSLERQNQRLEQLAHIVSHDLRSPLTVARGRLELAQDSADVSKLETAESALHRMNTIIEDALDMARYGQAVEEAELEAVTLGEIAESSWRAVESPEATLEIDGEVRFDADRSRLQNVFENLFRNAIDHGGSEVTVRVGPLPDGSGFYVEDDGVGIASEEDVFEPGHSTVETGTGLGLSIVDEIVTAHGWDIEATSADTGGARFEITGVDLR